MLCRNFKFSSGSYENEPNLSRTGSYEKEPNSSRIRSGVLIRIRIQIWVQVQVQYDSVQFVRLNSVQFGRDEISTVHTYIFLLIRILCLQQNVYISTLKGDMGLMSIYKHVDHPYFNKFFYPYQKIMKKKKFDQVIFYKIYLIFIDQSHNSLIWFVQVSTC